jgi:hypothetical protein
MPSTTDIGAPMQQMNKTSHRIVVAEFRQGNIQTAPISNIY